MALYRCGTNASKPDPSTGLSKGEYKTGFTQSGTTFNLKGGVTYALIGSMNLTKAAGDSIVGVTSTSTPQPAYTHTVHGTSTSTYQHAVFMPNYTPDNDCVITVRTSVDIGNVTNAAVLCAPI